MNSRLRSVWRSAVGGVVAIGPMVLFGSCGNDVDCSASRTCVSSDAGGQAAAGAPLTNGVAGVNGGGGDSIGGADAGGSSLSAAGTGEGGQGGDASGCAGDVPDDPTCWTTNGRGVFVSSEHGDDAKGDGTKEKPFMTIEKGVATAAGKNVYVCLGMTTDSYAERVLLDRAADGVRIYGGFDCEDWSYSQTRKATVASPDTIALRIVSVKRGVHIENMRFIAADGEGTDVSSYGAFITDSMNVVLRNVELRAGAGLKGADGDPGTKGDDGALPGIEQKGLPALCGGTPPDADGGSWVPTVCGSRGGPGGTGVRDSAGGDGFSGIPVSDSTEPPNNQNKGLGATNTLDDGGDGIEGADGKRGTPGVAARPLGVFTAAGYTPADGGDGSAGFSGQGGGGGGASRGTPTCRGASGGAGGMGGCGGLPGHGGRGGGASIGLLSWSSALTLQRCVVSGGPGGPGGAGGRAGGGGSGGRGGGSGLADPGNGIGRGGQGGDGGNGANAGSGAGGTGGPSFSVVFFGAKPSYTEPDSSLLSEAGGPAGIGGQLPSAKAPDGLKGASAAMFEVK